VADPAVEVVMHAPSADLTLLALAFGTRPANLFDTQTAAGFVGLGAGQSLATLLDRVLKVRLAKTEGYTDWARRPLSAAQLDYAAADVSHLLRLADTLIERASTRGRLEWVAEEHERRFGPGARLAPEPGESWRRVKGQGRLSPADRAVLARAAAWREREARRRDRPTQWVVPDRTLVEVARRRPATVQALLAERGIPERMRAEDLQGLLAAVRDGAGDPPIAMPPPPPPAVQARMEVLGPLGQVLVAARAGAIDLAPSLVATRDEVEGYLAAAIDGGAPDHPLGRGWRHALVGEALVALAEGRLSLAPTPSAPFLAEIPIG
jgi:ribonuclease D